MKWANLFDMDVPLDLMHEIEGQKEACDRIVSSKDELIREFVAELKAKDDEYVKSLKRQAEDVDIVIERMGKTVGNLGNIMLPGLILLLSIVKTKMPGRMSWGK